MSGGWTGVRDVKAVYPFEHFTYQVKSFFIPNSRKHGKPQTRQESW